MKKSLRKCYLSSLILLFVFLVSSCSKAPKEQAISKSAIYFDTPIAITIFYENGKEPSLDIFQKAFNECALFQSICDRHNKESELSRLNSRSLEYVILDNIHMYKVSSHLYNMITAGYNASINYSKEFDITIAPLINIWDFNNKYSLSSQAIPTQDAINDALKLVNNNSIILKEKDGAYLVGFAENNTTTQIDLGGLAKGYIADQLKKLLIENDIENALIDLGGNIYGLGSHLDGSDYVVGIKRPFTTKNELIQTVNIKNKSVVTSGIYERYFYHEDILYHHILSATTGYPAKTDLLSVTIIGDNSLDCDILSTTCLLIGKDLTTKLIEGLDNVSAILITTDYDVITVN